MSGYPGASYPGARPSGYGGGQYPGAQPQQYAGAPPQQSGGYRPPAQGGYQGGPQPGGYPGGGAQSQGYRPAAPGGYQGAPPGGSYPGGQQVDPQIAQWFSAVDQDRSGQIEAKELQRALVNGNWSHFSEEACRMMIDMFDRDKSGHINVHEFSSLFAYINQWKGLFESIDRDRSGFIEEAEFSQALQQMGYAFSPTFVTNLLAKYDGRTKRLTLDNFIVASVQIKRLTDSFRNRDREMRGQVMMQYEDFVGLALGAHK